tara:strand:+ start:39 stop:1550 length:1512 start_codon:yes stop_codon:yes gene_type:complete
MPLSADNLGLAAQPDQPAYVIYTSGSTGQPKGTVVSHRNVLRLFTSTEAWFRFTDDDVWTLFHSFAFDFSVWETWGALLYGGRLVVVPYEISRAPERFLQLLRTERVTVLNQTPSAFRQLLHADGEHRESLELRYVIFGGEALDPTMLRDWFAARGDERPRLVNMYGITETTVHVTYRPLTSDDANRAASLIGEPIPDLALYVLGEHGQPVPPTLPGELYVAGEGLAIGYLHRPELTAERFVASDVVGGARLYRTGDRVRRRANGELEYLGRVDTQVKIRGFRIELGEIGALLAQHDDVREAVATVFERCGDRSLVAYFVPANGAPSVESMRAHLAQHLPSYMVPARFVALDQLPLTVNGKLDYKALPAPSREVDEARTERPVRDARDATEQAVLDVWRELLEHPSLSIDDNVFEQGAHSVLAVQARSRLEPMVGQAIAVVLLFQHPTSAGLAAALRELTADESIREPTSDRGAQRAALRREARNKRTARRRPGRGNQQDPES